MKREKKKKAFLVVKVVINQNAYNPRALLWIEFDEKRE